MRNIYLIAITVLLPILFGCNGINNHTNTDQGNSKVEIRQSDGNYRLFVDGEAFYVKGAGCECWDIESLAKTGANAFRTWMDSPAHRDGLELLDEAHAHGLKVLMGIKVGRERHGFDYNDAEAVAQ